MTMTTSAVILPSGEPYGRWSDVSAHVAGAGPRAVAPAALPLQGTALPAARLRAGADAFGAVVDAAPPARGAPV